MRPTWPLFVLLLGACTRSTSDADTPGADAAGSSSAPDAVVADAALDAIVADASGGKDAACASTFGNVLTDAFGRVDGTVLAILEPGNPRCPTSNSDHVVLEVLVDGLAYRMVVNVLSTGADPDIRIRSLDAALPAPGFLEGWHPGLSLDYATHLGVHSADAAWQPYPIAAASAHVIDAITVGQPIAVYATSSGGTRADSTHLVHRNRNTQDGAIVLDPTGPTPHWLLFSFANQTF